MSCGLVNYFDPDEDHDSTFMTDEEFIRLQNLKKATDMSPLELLDQSSTFSEACKRSPSREGSPKVGKEVIVESRSFPTSREGKVLRSSFSFPLFPMHATKNLSHLTRPNPPLCHESYVSDTKW
jgi:hypothetical protein